MKNRDYFFFVCLGIFSLYHFVRDLFQQIGIENVVTAPLRLLTHWCGSYCNTITFPFEVGIFLGSLLILKRKKSGVVGTCIVLVFLIWICMFLYDALIFNRG